MRSLILITPFVLLFSPTLVYANTSAQIGASITIESSDSLGYNNPQDVPNDYIIPDSEGWWDRQCCLQLQSRHGLFSDQCFEPDRMNRLNNTRMCEVL